MRRWRSVNERQPRGNLVTSSRRSFLGRAAAATILSATTQIEASAQLTTQQVNARRRASRTTSLVDVLRLPDFVTAFAGLASRLPLSLKGGAFRAKDVTVGFVQTEGELGIRIGARATALTHVRLRWRYPVDDGWMCLGDQWERSYGNLGWRGLTPERAMPWYCATHDGHTTNGYGVKTGAAAMCFWQLDPEGISLWLDVSNGGSGVELGERILSAATIVSREGNEDESPLEAVRGLCREICPSPRLPGGAVYGVNDWYTAYGKNNEQMLLRMTDLVAELAPAGGARPYTVVDMGWKDGSAGFPSMAGFAEQVRKRGARPGIWIRPLEAPADADAALLLPDQRFGTRGELARERAFDPTHPEAMERVRRKFQELADWKFELVKHDFSSYDFLGQWGFEMGAQPSIPGWHPHDRSRTNAEILLDFYKELRGVLGEHIGILGCNTVGHLGAGVFELQRTGDDTSGRVWERTRRMGVNTLAYRLPQHGTFFGVDPDCVGITKEVPWGMNSQWLDVVAKSHTALFISPEEGQVGAEQKEAIRRAFAEVTSNAKGFEPADFLHDTTPERWKRGGEEKRYRWCDAEGALPFPV